MALAKVEERIHRLELALNTQRALNGGRPADYWTIFSLSQETRFLGSSQH